MTFGTVHSYPQNPRVAKALIAAQYNGVEIAQPEFEFGKTNKTPDFLAKFPTGQVPAFENDKVNLFESNAIAYYVASQGNGRLLGTNAEETAQVVQWLFFTSNNFDQSIGNWVYPILGFLPFNKATHNKAVQDTKSAMAILDKVLLKKTFLVGEHITLADIVVACTLFIAYKMVLAPEHRVAYKNLNRYVSTLYAQPEFKAALGEVVFCDVETKYTPPKKEEAPKPAAAPAAAEAEEPAKKPKSKLELLPPTSLNLEEWKRVYSNNDTKPTAMNWFWEHFDAEGYSIWRVVYKYNDELTKVFMSSNLIGGFFAVWNVLASTLSVLYAFWVKITPTRSKVSLSSVARKSQKKLPTLPILSPTPSPRLKTWLMRSSAKNWPMYLPGRANSLARNSPMPRSSNKPFFCILSQECR
ncbi:glutathione S-transferase [Syncephalis fuscata]|nr:glutathione S-transferase [Syncephalis fuscata]